MPYSRFGVADGDGAGDGVELGGAVGMANVAVGGTGEAVGVAVGEAGGDEQPQMNRLTHRQAGSIDGEWRRLALGPAPCPDRRATSTARPWPDDPLTD